VVLARNLAPFRVMCYPLFDPRHPEHGLHTCITEIVIRLSVLENPSEKKQTVSESSESPTNEPLEIARLILMAVEQTWPCELLRERGKIIAVRLKPRAPFSPANI
jgi:hypothetical protein